jgi:hypothetical protein
MSKKEKYIQVGNNLQTIGAPSILNREVFYFSTGSGTPFTLGVAATRIVCVPVRLKALLDQPIKAAIADYEKRKYNIEKIY